MGCQECGYSCGKECDNGYEIDDPNRKYKSNSSRNYEMSQGG